MALELNTSIRINATPEKIWTIFSAFETYGEWNPFIKAIEGKPQVGNSIKVVFDEMTFKPKVLVFNPNQKMEWIGRLGFRGLFDGRHSFVLTPNGDGTTTFIQQEFFSGLLVPLFRKKLLTETKKGFEQMNAALKQRVEAVS